MDEANIKFPAMFKDARIEERSKFINVQNLLKITGRKADQTKAAIWHELSHFPKNIPWNSACGHLERLLQTTNC